MFVAMTHSEFAICFCKQKTAYEMRISNWSSDVCSSDLLQRAGAHRLPVPHVDEGAVCGVMQPALVGAAGTPVQRLRPQVRAVQRRQMRVARQHDRELVLVEYVLVLAGIVALQDAPADRKSTRLKSSH